MVKKLQVQTGAGGCCESDDPCNLFASGGAYVDVDGTWSTGTDGGYAYIGTTDTAAITKWDDSSTFGDNYILCGRVKIETEGEKAVLYFGYKLSDDSYGGYVEITAGDSGTGAGGRVKLYIGGVLKTNVQVAVYAESWFTIGICIGAVIVSTCDEFSINNNTVNTINVTSGDAGDCTKVLYGWATYTVTTVARSYAVGTGGANTGYVRWHFSSWEKTSVVADSPFGGGYDCNICSDSCGYCKDATRQTYITATFDTPDGTSLIPSYNDPFADQSFELVYNPNGCEWSISWTLNDGAFDYDLSVIVNIVCCDGIYYLQFITIVNHPIGGQSCDAWYYELTDWDFNCDLADLTLDEDNTEISVHFPDCVHTAGCASSMTNDGEFIFGNNTVLLEFHN